MNKEMDARKYGLDIGDILPILNSISQAIFIDDAEGYALWINKACEEIYRIKRKILSGSIVRTWNIWGSLNPPLQGVCLKKKGSHHPS